MSAELKGIQEASMELLFRRSAATEQENVAIISHYPDGFQEGANFRKMFLDGVPEHRRDTLTIFNFFGYTHVQECRGYDEHGHCTDFLSGGGGGTCRDSDVPAGFAAVSFSSQNASQFVECFLDEPCTLTAFPEAP